MVTIRGRGRPHPDPPVTPPAAPLPSLSGHQHSIITGVAVVRPRRGPASSDPEADPEVTLFHEETRVTFSPLSEPLLREYVECGEPM